MDTFTPPPALPTLRPVLYYPHYGKKTIPQHHPHPLLPHRDAARQPRLRIRGGDHARASSILPPAPSSPRGRQDAPRRTLPHCGRLPIAPRRLLLRSPSVRPIHDRHRPTRRPQVTPSRPQAAPQDMPPRTRPARIPLPRPTAERQPEHQPARQGDRQCLNAA